MNILKHTPLILFIFASSAVVCQITPKQFLGTWTTKRSDERTYSTTEETWVFQTVSRGTWTRKLIMSEGVVTCNVTNPFTWKFTTAKKLELTLGKTDCKCAAAKKKFEDGLDDFIKNYKEFYNNGYLSYKVKSVDNKAISLEDFTLTKH